MNAQQRYILNKARKTYAEAKERAKALEIVNEDPEKQYAWDDWQRAQAYADGLSMGVSWLEAALKPIKRIK